MIDPETKAYLDEPWTTNAAGRDFTAGIFGVDGQPILTCDHWNKAHLLTPADVAEYLMMLHSYYLMRRTEAE